MKQSLSSREKILITLALVLGLVFGATRLLLMPLYENFMAAQEEYQLLRGQHMLQQVKLSQKENTRRQYAEAQQLYLEIAEEYPDMMFAEKVDKLLTGICLENGLTPMRLKMSDPQKLNQQLSTDEAAGPGEDDQQEETAIMAAEFWQMETTMDLAGSYEQLQGLINTTANISYLRISSVTYALPQENSRINMSNISVNFQVTMLNDVLPVAAI